MRYQPGQSIDHYEIVEALGEGAYGEAYKARDTRTGRYVLLKSPNPQLLADPGIYQRFKRETDITRSLDHPGVQRSTDFQEDHGDPYLVLDYIEGRNLREWLQRATERVPIDLAVQWGVQLAEALAYLHEKGIVHRDLKPENVLVGDDGQLRIVDFGTALAVGARRLTWRNLTDSVGTPDYMSPEQIQGERGDARSDIYSWGVIMYELLAGHVPFAGDNWLAVMAGHLQRSPERITQARPEVTPALEAVVLKAMRRFPKNRYQSAGELLGDLENLDTLDAATIDLSPEPTMGGLSAAQTPAQLWLRLGLIVVGFFVLLALVIAISVVMKR